MPLTEDPTSSISYLRYLQHLRVEPVEVEHKLSQAYERQLDRKHLPEGPVVRGVGECVESPFLQHAARHHVPLHFLQDVPEDLVVDGRGEQRGLSGSS